MKFETESFKIGDSMIFYIKMDKLLQVMFILSNDTLLSIMVSNLDFNLHEWLELCNILHFTVSH